MIRQMAPVLLLLASCSAEHYPLHEMAVHGPRSFDLLYSSTSGDHNETWYFNTPVNITHIIIASQVFNFESAGLWPNATYIEDLDIFVYETQLASDAADEVTTLVGSGTYAGVVDFGQELSIPMTSNTTGSGDCFTAQQFVDYDEGCSYVFRLVFRSTGMYPWFTSRVLTSYSCVNENTNGGGVILGVTFSQA